MTNNLKYQITVLSHSKLSMNQIGLKWMFDIICAWSLYGSSVNIYWMIIECWPPRCHSPIDNFQSISLALTSLRSCRLVIASCPLDSSTSMNIPLASQSQHVKIYLINFPSLERRHNLGIKNMESGILVWFRFTAPVLNGCVTLGKSLNSFLPMWGCS